MVTVARDVASCEGGGSSCVHRDELCRVGLAETQSGETLVLDSPWFTSREACAYLRYTGKAQLVSLYRFLKANGIATARRNGRLLIARRDLDRAIGARHVVRKAGH